MESISILLLKGSDRYTLFSLKKSAFLYIYKMTFVRGRHVNFKNKVESIKSIIIVW